MTRFGSLESMIVLRLFSSPLTKRFGPFMEQLTQFATRRHLIFFLAASVSIAADAAALSSNNSLALEAEHSLNFTSPNEATLGPSPSTTDQTFASFNSSSVSDLSPGSNATFPNGKKCHHHLRPNGTFAAEPNSTSAWAALVQSLPFLPILIVLATMFVCLCVVLRLFSKARFRNNRSSIFVNPQTLKVAQAQERRMSQLSQLSGSGLRTPRSPRSPRTPNRSPIHSMRSARSSYGSNVYPINEPITVHTPNSILMKEKSRSNSISSSKLLP